MSGICALLRLDGAPAEAEALAPVIAGLAARGPDRSGLAADGPAALGHALLATTPEAVVEPMPLRHAGSGCLITADVRLDNRDELIAKLGIDAASRIIGDGELILAAYLKWGIDCASHLLGDFAFVIWDLRHQRLFAARDKVGMRQLIYHFADGKLLACATDALALLNHPDVPHRINEGRIADYLENMEAIDSTSTFFEGLCRLPPAHALTVENGALRTWRYWQLTAPPIILRKRDEDYEEAFLEVFTQAVRDRLRSPDPVGSMLSGGMDSGSVVTVAARLLHQSGAPPLPTFSAVHSDPDCAESRAIRLAMTVPHIDPQVVSSAAPEEYRDEVAAMIRTCAEPFDGHMAMVMAIYAKARRSGIKTMLDGVSGDTTISTGNIVQWHLDEGRLWQAWQEARADERYWGHFMPARQQFAKLARRKFAPPPLRAAWQQIKPLLRPEHFDGIAPLNAEFAQRINIDARRQAFREHTSTPNDVRAEPRARRMLHPFAIAGRERYDRVAGAFGIEPRDPFLDTRLLEFCLTLPVDQIKRDGWPKRMLRRSMAGLMPDELRWRTGRTHVGGWFNAACRIADGTDVATDIADSLGAYISHAGALHRNAARHDDVALANANDLEYLRAWVRYVAERREVGDWA